MGNILTMTDALGNTVTYTYDVLGRLLTQSIPFDETSTQISKYDYDANGNLTMTRITNNAVGENTSYSKTVNTYDNMNRMISTESYDGENVALTNSYTYNAYDKVLTMTTGGATTTYTYNTRGEQTKLTDALGKNEIYTYDLGGNLLTKTDRNGTVFTYTYDRLGRLLSETATSGTKTEQKTYVYSISGALISEADGDVTITRKYDCLGRLIEETETANSKNAVSRYAYTKTDERQRYMQVYQNQTLLSEYYEYDAVGRLVKVYTSTAEWDIIDGTEAPPPPPVPQPDPYDFDSYPNLTTYEIRDSQNVVLYRYKLIPLSGTELVFDLVYDLQGVQYGVCFETTLNYKHCGTLYGLYYWGSFVFMYEDGAGGWVEGEQFELMIVTSNPPGLYEYDIIMEYYIYDGDTLCQSLAATLNPENDLMVYLYISDGEFNFRPEWYTPQTTSTVLTETEETTETLITTYGYDANGNRISMTNANGTSAVYTYNKANLVTSVQNKKGSTVLSSHTYTYYLDGNIKTEVVDGDTKTYTYDDLGRLTREVKSGILSADDIVYTYDARGNRATRTQGPATTTYTYDANNRLLAETTSVSNTLYTYDANGNTLSAMKDGTLVYSYTYGLFGTQDSYTSDAILYTYYTYRPDGLRHSIGDTIHIWDGANIVADVEGNDITTYFRGINLIYVEEDGEQTYYHFNAHGDVVVLTNDIGEKEKTYSYTSFGIEYNPNTFDTNPFRYCGEYYDIESGNIYLRARYYNADLGRFTQEDPIRDGRNWYSYCDSNPVVRIDRTGQAWETFWDIASLCVSIGEVIANPTDPMNWIGAAGDLVDVLVPCLGGVGETIRAIDAATDIAKVADDVHDAVKAIDKVEDAVDAIDDVHDTGKAIKEVTETATDTAKSGWHVGDDITVKTKAGNDPSWSTVRQRYWKNEAHYHSNDNIYSAKDIDRMKEGKPPLVKYEANGKYYPMELHHIEARHKGGSHAYENLEKVTPWKHSEIDPYRHFVP